jgi:succinyl-CoA synthetase alpha subunit
MPTFNFVRRSFYRDSVSLMRLSRDLEAMAGIEAAAAMMGTPANVALLERAGLLTAEGAAARPGDLVVAVTADCRESADAAREAVERALLDVPRTGTAAEGARPRTLRGALRAMPDANLALISVPGSYAGAEARAALEAGLHVMLFSDNVPVETEVSLKRAALERGLLLMGPDCGTALVDGVPLGFVNRVPRGRVGLAAASGTGLQEVMCTLAREGEGVSQALGVGGRDLGDEVGGLMMLHALDLLAADAATEVVCVVGKPPGRAVAERLDRALSRLAKPCVVYFPPIPGRAVETAPSGGRAHVATTLEDAGRAAAALARGVGPVPGPAASPDPDLERLADEAGRRLEPGARFVRGVYAGGTLAYEAAALLAESLGHVATSPTPAAGHAVVDLGDDAFTAGRPHPMIDGRARREMIRTDGRDPRTAVLLLDVVLGHGTPPDPAGEILPAIRAVRRARDLPVVASVCGTDGDIPSRAAQTAALRAAGVTVMESNARAARLAAAIARRARGDGR